MIIITRQSRHRLRPVLISLLSILSAISLSSCTVDTTENENSYGKKVAEKDFFDFSEPKNSDYPSRDVIAKAGESINSSVMQLEKIERYRKPRIINVTDDNMAKYNLGHKVQVDWSGPIEPLVSEIAAYSNYRFKVVGIAPAIPILVDVSHQNVSIGEVIREAHLQAKERANLVIYPKSKTIELRYNEIG